MVPYKALWNILSQSMPHQLDPRPEDNRVFQFTQQVDLGTVVTTSNAVATTGSQIFTFGQIPNSTSYAALFDQYRIDEIEFWLYTTVLNSSGVAGTLYSAVDYDGAPTLSVAQISQYSNVLLGPIALGHYHRFKPHVAIASYGSGAFSSYANAASQWVDSAYTTVSHFGVVITCGVTGTNALTIEGQARFHFSARNVV
jgi:hypothetical protein